MKLLFVLLPLLTFGCNTKASSTGDDTQGTSDNGGGDTSTSGDDTSGGNNGGGNGGGDTGVCNDANEDCTPNTCGGEGDNMLPGSDCLTCHTSRSMAAPPPESAPPWTLGGTLFDDALGTAGVSGATVTVTDSNGQTATMTTSRVGNFYWSRSLTPPFTASVTTSSGTREMKESFDTGACNSCHKCDGEAGGKLYAP